MGRNNQTLSKKENSHRKIANIVPLPGFRLIIRNEKYIQTSISNRNLHHLLKCVIRALQGRNPRFPKNFSPSRRILHLHLLSSQGMPCGLLVRKQQQKQGTQLLCGHLLEIPAAGACTAPRQLENRRRGRGMNYF